MNVYSVGLPSRRSVTADPHPLDLITGVLPDAEVSPVRVEVIDDSSVSTTLSSDVLSVVALGDVVEQAAERLVRLRDVERELAESRETCNQLRSEAEHLRNELSRIEAVLAQVNKLQRRLQDVLDLP